MGYENEAKCEQTGRDEDDDSYCKWMCGVTIKNSNPIYELSLGVAWT